MRDTPAYHIRPDGDTFLWKSKMMFQRESETGPERERKSVGTGAVNSTHASLAGWKNPRRQA